MSVERSRLGTGSQGNGYSRLVRPKFLADADLSEKIIEGIVRLELAIDTLDANEGGTRGLPDHEVLRIAAASGRILISHDRNTMIRHFREFTTSQAC